MTKRFLLICFGVLMLAAVLFSACNFGYTPEDPNNPPPDPNAPDINVVINQIYGRGIETRDLNVSLSPISHSFVELYNKGDTDANLSGYALYVGYNTESKSYWNGKLNLSGVIPPKTSFLIAVRQATSAVSPRYTITSSMIDQEWPGSAFSTSDNRVGFNNKNLKVLLIRGTTLTLAQIEKNPYDLDGEQMTGYIDMLSMSGNEYLLESDKKPVDAYEGENGALAGQSRNKAIRRKFFTDTNDSYADVRAIDYRAHHLTDEGLARVRPRCLADGAWTNYDDRRPDHVIINQVYGKAEEVESAVSNSFIELYNPTKTDVDLSGKSIQFSAGGTEWTSLTFEPGDVIPANSSFLIVFPEFRNDSALRTLNINNADKLWQTEALPNQNLKVALMDNAAKLTVVNPSGNESCIDFIGISGSNNNDKLRPGIDAFEGSATKEGLSKQKSVRRKFFLDTDQNMDDLEFIDFRAYSGDEENGISDERLYDALLGSWPKSRIDGAWGQAVQ